MRISCPHCHDRAITRTSKRPSPVFYEVYAQCINTACGWGGKLFVEFALTTSPSRLPCADVRIPVEEASRLVLLEQLNND